MKKIFKNYIKSFSLIICVVFLTGCVSSPDGDVIEDFDNTATNPAVTRDKSSGPVVIQVIDDNQEFTQLDSQNQNDFQSDFYYEDYDEYYMNNYAYTEDEVEFIDDDFYNAFENKDTYQNDQIADFNYIDEPEQVFYGPQEYQINLSDQLKRFTIIKNVSDGVEWNYQNITSLKAFYTDKLLPKKGDTITIIFTGTCDADINAPVYLSLIENLTGKTDWINLVSDNEDEKYVVFAENIQKDVPFTATATFVLEKNCETNISLHFIYPVKDGTTSSTWTLLK